jgi:hypothetical protein
MVRDDFWMAVTRFMQTLEVELVSGKNIQAVDLFDLRHARKVLMAFGRAFGILPGTLSTENETFLDQAVSGLAQDGKVISVRLALFAEMVKGKTWTQPTLKEVGGIDGIGVTFLEETFRSRTANPKHRFHEQAARAILKVLLPEIGTEIKGHMRSHADLLVASGYAGRPRDFDDLIRILDGELRLITPIDPDVAAREERYFQLTHDYLVPSLRDWLTRKQKETSKGRAELLLAERVALWKAKPEWVYPFTLLEWVWILYLTKWSKWTRDEQRMLRAFSPIGSPIALLFFLWTLGAAIVTLAMVIMPLIAFDTEQDLLKGSARAVLVPLGGVLAFAILMLPAVILRGILVAAPRPPVVL